MTNFVVGKLSGKITAMEVRTRCQGRNFGFSIGVQIISQNIATDIRVNGVSAFKGQEQLLLELFRCQPH